MVLDDHPSDEAKHLASALNVPHLIAKILLHRGIRSLEEAKAFFRPSLENLHDPFLMPDMERAVRRVLQAIRRGERILIYGDYDVDGTTGTALLYLFFQALGYPVSFYIPDRLREGYGLSARGVEEARRQGVGLIIAVDCGVTANEPIGLARSLGMDVIVCDHHEPGPGGLPPAVAILDPKRSDSRYPFSELAGVGVAFKLGQAIAQARSVSDDSLMKLVSLVAIGSAADIVPLIDENRIFVKEGLRQLNQSTNVGLHALLEASGLRGPARPGSYGIGGREINTGQVVFILAPRINAVGRLGDAARAVHLLTTDSPQLARNIAAILESENRHRRRIDEDMFRHAQGIVEKEIDLPNTKALVLNFDGWHPGVIGIVASRLVEKYYRPTVMIATEAGMGKGSARSIPGFDLYQALKECADLVETFGGHRHAAGLTIREENIPAFRQRFHRVAADRLSDEDLIPKLRIDGEIRLREIDARFLRLLKLFAPFGPQNMRPVFLSRHVQIVGTPTVVGNNHLKFKVRQDGVVIDAIGFNLGDLIYRIAPGESNVDVVYGIEENDWQGRKVVQLRVKDLR